jgi:membrane protein DedA with SNARE-associated domain
VEQVLSDLVLWLEGVRPLWVYVAVLLVSYLENVVPPIPGDLLIVFVGYLVGVGQVGFVPTLALAALGGLLGFMTMFWVGWRVGPVLLDTRRMRWVPKRGARRALGWLARYGYGVVAVNRFLSGGRSVIALMAGAARMHPSLTALWSGVSSLLWCALLIYAGYVLGDQWEVVGRYLQLYGQWVMGGLILGAAGWFALRWCRRQRDRRRTGEDLPKGPSAPSAH